MKREHEWYPKLTSDNSEEICENSYNNDDFYYYKKNFIENGTLDDLFDFE